ncbi:hypothetical protein M407DRAFT_31521 [Tulasnella calospora MUT 4182]|uniref:C2H2-type domain-containing protein n=1 Tax=Tulasnella calospora MUT 4182 TaxID=1051891 RepID=A0A0C3LBC9_9AGAM|nr:hypothetical protein M407DRAFT_31521 [Tulasnella calospora MUT 4182]
MDFAAYESGLTSARSDRFLEAPDVDNTSISPAFFYTRSPVQHAVPESACTTVSWPFPGFLHEQRPVAEFTSQPHCLPSSADVRGLAPVPSSLISFSAHQSAIKADPSATFSGPQARLVSSGSQGHVATSLSPGAMSFAAAPAAKYDYSMVPRPSPPSAGQCGVDLLASSSSSSHDPLLFERYEVEKPVSGPSFRSRIAPFADHARQVASYRNIIPDQSTGEYCSSRHARFSVRAVTTVPTTTIVTSVPPALTYGGSLQQIEEVKSAKRQSLTGQHDPEAATAAEVNQRRSRRSDLEPTRSGVVEYINQYSGGRDGFPSLTNRQATYPPRPSYPGTRHALNSSPSRRHTYHEEPFFHNTGLPTDIFAHQYTSLQEWLSEADVILSPSLSPTADQTLPPEVTFPDLDLLDAEIEEEEASMWSDAYFAIEGVGEVRVANLDGDAVMEEDDEDVDAEGSTEDESEVISDLDEPEDDSDDSLQEVTGGTAEEEVPESSSPTRLQEDAQSPHDNAPKVPSFAPTRSSTADTLTTDTAGSPNDTASRRSPSVDAPTTPSSIPSRDGSVLSSADGEGETDEEYVGSSDEEDEEDTASASASSASASAAGSRSPSPASSISIPLSSCRPAASRTSPDQESKHTLDDVACRSPAPSTPPPKLPFTKGQTRAPYQRSRPASQPLDGIPDGSAEYSEVTKTYKCTCHGRTYRRKGDLQRHLCEGSLPEVCDGCGRGFPRKDPRIRHWNQNPVCEAIHHVKNIRDSKEASRWKKRWTSAMFAGKAAAMERLVEDQLSILASGSNLTNQLENIIPQTRTRTRVAAAARGPRHRKVVKRRFDSEGETEDESIEEECEEEDSFRPSKLVKLAIVKDDLVSEGRRATLRKKVQ